MNSPNSIGLHLNTGVATWSAMTDRMVMIIIIALIINRTLKSVIKVIFLTACNRQNAKNTKTMIKLVVNVVQNPCRAFTHLI